MSEENKFKIGDLVIYAHKVESPSADFVERYYMKPAKVTHVIGEPFPYEIQLLNSEEKSVFMEKELEFVFQTKEELDTLLIKGHIDQESYERLIKTIEV